MENNVSSGHGISNSTTAENPAMNIFIYGYNNFDNKLPKTVAYSIILFLSIFGNSFIVATIYKDSRLKSTTNFLVANMAISDLLAAVFFIPLRLVLLHSNGKWSIDGVFAQLLCRICNFFPKTSTSVSFYSCLFIAIDRYLAVAYPLKGGFERSRLKYIITAIWLFSGIILSPYFYLLSVEKYKESAYCIVIDESSFLVHFYVIVFVCLGIPFPTISALYIAIVYKLRQHKAPGTQSEIIQQRRKEQNRKILRMAISIVALLYLSWGFFSITYLVGFGGNVNIDHVKSFAIFLSLSSFSYNFFLYLIFNEIYRENFKSMLSRFLCNINITRGCHVEINAAENTDCENTTNTSCSGIHLTRLQFVR